MDGSDSATACDKCEIQHDTADIYPVYGLELCEKCKKAQDYGPEPCCEAEHDDDKGRLIWRTGVTRSQPHRHARVAKRKRQRQARKQSR